MGPAAQLGGVAGGASRGVYDNVSTERQPDAWVAAKRQCQFHVADAIRAELRAKGINPDDVRPSDKDLQERPEQVIEKLAERWEKAKRSKDFMTADLLRNQLLKLGVDPDAATQQTEESAKRQKPMDEYDWFTSTGGL